MIRLQAPLDSQQVQYELTNDERTWGMLCHLAALASYIIPLGNIIGPLVVWLVKRNEYAYADWHGKESVNFQLSLMLYVICLIPFMFFFIIIPFFGVFMFIFVSLLAKLAFPIILLCMGGAGAPVRSQHAYAGAGQSILCQWGSEIRHLLGEGRVPWPNRSRPRTSPG